MRKRIIDNNQVVIFNQKRLNNQGKGLTRAEMQKALKEINFPADDAHFSKYIESNAIIRHSQGRQVFYTWPKDPIMKHQLQHVIDACCKKKDKSFVTTVSTEEKIANAINLLKSLGYRVLKKDWIEI